MSSDINQAVDLESGGGHFPWSELEDLEYEIWATKREIASYNETMAKIDAEGGDISAELYPPSDAEPIVEPTQEVIQDEQATYP